MWRSASPEVLYCQAVEQMQSEQHCLQDALRCVDDCKRPVQVILVGGKQSASIKARHGLTPPMRDAERRMFDHTPIVDQKVMQKLEDDLLTIAQVSCWGPCQISTCNAAKAPSSIATARLCHASLHVAG
jgi:hypothetical protein